MKTTGNTVLITGGSSGIGLEMALRFLKLGNEVIITGRNSQKLDEIKRNFPALHIICCDITTHLDDLVLQIEQKHSNVNVLINNAAVQYNYNLLEESNAVNLITYETETNLAAPIKLTALLLPLLLKNKESAVINISSALAITPKKTASVYCATKAAMHSFSISLRYQLENTGMRVFEILPPLVETPMTEGRGTGKLSTEKLVDKCMRGFERDMFEMYIGKARLLKLLHRIWPRKAARIIKNGL